MTARPAGFAPVIAPDSRVLILGSFPSVKSRAVGFYYGNPQNRFWRTLCGFFGEEIPPSAEEKRAFLLRRRVALWDIVTSCEIKGSADASIRAETVADLPALLEASAVEAIFTNGSKPYEILGKRFPDLLPMTVKLPSTSPANPRFSEEAWRLALSEAFPAARR